MSELVHVTTADRVATVRLDRADKKNALSVAMYGALRDALERADRDPEVRAIIITGGDECFSAGNDLADFARAAAGGDLTAPFEFLLAIAAIEKPLVAAVSGVAIGIGTTLLLHCDLAFAAPGARFKTPFVDLGLVPEAASSLLVPLLVGHRRAVSLLMLGEELDAATALAWGLVNAVVDDPLAAARAAAARLATRAPGAVRATKALMKRAGRALVEETIRVEAETFGERLKSPEAKEAFAAFLGRRAPDFSKF